MKEAEMDRAFGTCERNVFMILVVKPGSKGLLVKSRVRWTGNIEAGLEEIENVNWSHLAPLSVFGLCSHPGFKNTKRVYGDRVCLHPGAKGVAEAPVDVG
jgi:hypothetical protein